MHLYKAGDGNDVVKGNFDNYTVGLISCSIDSSYYRGNDLVWKIGSGSITFKNLKNSSNISVVTPNNQNLITNNPLWTEENFVTADDMRLITLKDSSSGVVEKMDTSAFNSYDTFTATDPLLTYTEK